MSGALWALINYFLSFYSPCNLKVIVLIVMHSLHTVAAHTFTVGTVTRWIPWLKKSQTQTRPHLSPLVSLFPSLRFSSLLPPVTSSLFCLLWCYSSECRAPIDLTVPPKFDPSSPHSCCLGLIQRLCWLAVWMSRPHVSLCTQNLFPHQSWEKKNMSKLIRRDEIFRVTSVSFWNNSYCCWHLW